MAALLDRCSTLQVVTFRRGSSALGSAIAPMRSGLGAQGELAAAGHQVRVLLACQDAAAALGAPLGTAGKSAC